MAQAAKRPESIHLPPAPSSRSSQARAILAVAGTFARAYLRYQTGQHPPAVEQALRATSTDSFTRILLSQPATVPSSSRSNPTYQPATLSSLIYTGAASLGPGSPEQIVVAAYRVINHPTVGGQILIHLTQAARGWRVARLG